MATYQVMFEIPVSVTVEVEADNETDAIDQARDDAELKQLVGNGSNGDRLIGTDSRNVSLRVDGEPLEGECYFEINVEKIE